MSKGVFVKVKRNTYWNTWIYSNLTGTIYEDRPRVQVFLDERSKKILRERNRRNCENYTMNPKIYAEDLIINPARGLVNE